MMRTISIRFACLSDGAIGAFHADENNQVYTYEHNHKRWNPTHPGRLILVNMDDICPAYELPDYEFRTYNEFIVHKMLRRTCGDGTLTIVHRMGWLWHFGMAWTLKPISLKYGQATNTPPRWWNAEDLWCECPPVEELVQRIDRDIASANARWAQLSARANWALRQARMELGPEATAHEVEDAACDIMGQRRRERPPPPDPRFRAMMENALRGL